MSPRGLVAHAEAFLDTPAVPWKPLITGLLWVVFAFETYVRWRQYRLYLLATPPKALMAHVSHDDFVKSQRYNRDKATFTFVSSALTHAAALAAVHYNLSAHLWVLAGALLERLHVPGSEPALSAASMVLAGAVQLPLSLATGAYMTFVIEERHGFNKQTWRTFLLDHVKQLLLSVVILVPLVMLFVVVVRATGDQFVTYTVALVMAFVLIGSVIYPTLIQPLFNKLTPLPEGVLRDRVTALASQLQFPLKHLYVIDGSKRSSHSNAYFYGVVPGGSKHIVIFDTLIEQSTPDEIEAVLAHELGHWVHSHPTSLLALSFAQILFNLSLFAVFIHNSSLFRAFGFGADRAAVARVDYLPVTVGLELFNLVVHPLDVLLEFLVNSIIRRFEYQADRYVAHRAHAALPPSRRAPPRPPTSKRRASASRRWPTATSPRPRRASRCSAGSSIWARAAPTRCRARPTSARSTRSC